MLKSKTSQTITFRGWSGEVSDLERIARALDELRDSARANLAHSYRESDGSREETARKEALRWSDELPKDWAITWKHSNESTLQEFLEEIRVEMAVTQGYRTIEGAPETVLPLIDSSEPIGQISFRLTKSYRMPGPDLQLVLSIRETRLAVSGANDSWVLSAMAKLKPIVERNRPKYLRVRNIGYFVALIPAVCVALTIIFNLGPNIDKELRAILTFLLIVAAFNAPFAAIGPWRRLFPTFELRPPGGRPQGARTASRVVAITVWLLGTIVIPIILALIMK